jgi:hypothetical protein
MKKRTFFGVMAIVSVVALGTIFLFPRSEYVAGMYFSALLLFIWGIFQVSSTEATKEPSKKELIRKVYALSISFVFLAAVTIDVISNDILSGPRALSLSGGILVLIILILAKKAWAFICWMVKEYQLFSR